MKKFMDKNFLLDTDTARKLYHGYAKDMPIIDYHCHINPRDIAEDKAFDTITEAWLGADHYKWRALRTNGIDESYITGSKDDFDKFTMWAKTVPYTIGNPLYHWTHMELRKYFGIEELLSENTADEIYTKCNMQLKSMSARKMIKANNVRIICTTDDPVDTLEYHMKIRNDDSFNVKVLPTFRADKAINIEVEGYYGWLDRLQQVHGKAIKTFDEYKIALIERIDFFHSRGCRISDHGIERISYIDSSEEEIAELFDMVLHKRTLSTDQVNTLKTAMFVFLGREYSKRNWAMQYHIGALRNNSTRMLRKIGVDSGFDSIDDSSFATDISRIMDRLDKADELPRTILYCLNPKDNEMAAAMVGSFQDGKTRGKIQFGAAWWFNDQKDGIQRHIEVLCQSGLISTFVGMLTDSRSLLSYTRHEYFRRILCNKFGNLVENGEYPNDIEFVGKIVQDICYNNAKEYFGL